MLEGYVRKGTLTEEILQKYMKELFDLRQAAAADVRAKIEALRQQQATAKDEKPAEQTVNG
jgi:RecB family exonuclease